MNIFKVHPLFSTSKTYFFLVLLISVLSCKNDKKSDKTLTEQDNQEKIVSVMESGKVDILTTAMEFQMPDTLPAGWLHFRYKNASAEPHFFILEKYPEGHGIEDAKRDLIPIFQDAMDSIMVNKFDEGMKRFDSLPEWFHEVVFQGGSGLVSPGIVSDSYVNLQPGYYLIECYVKMPNGKFHSSMGMLDEFYVVDEWSPLSKPSSDIDIVLSSEEGIVFNDSISAGDHTFSVFHKDAKLYGNFVSHDVHLVRLDDESVIEGLNNWMSWIDKEGYMSPGPKGVTFLGGSQEMPVGSTSFFTASLTPGLYALVSEVPEPKSKKLLKVFTVSE